MHFILLIINILHQKKIQKKLINFTFSNLKPKSLTNKLSSTLNPIGIIILAAGASRRMGTPKQLLKIDNQTLIERAIDLTQALDNQQTVVVLGANAEKISPYITQQATVEVIINENWEQGMGTTLKKGVEFFLAKPITYDAIIIMVCDQPYLTTKKLRELIAAYRDNNVAIIATIYNNIKGVPALFANSLFGKLKTLNKDEGARKIIKNYKGEIITIDFPEGIFDLDTPATYQEFLKQQL